MESITICLALSILAVVLSIYSLFRTRQIPAPAPAVGKFEGTSLRLQAYERLVLLTERISLPNLISRLSQPSLSAVEMKVILTENIKQEFEYNSTQQLYVGQVAWDAVRNLKEQNIMIIHQVAATLPANASSTDLNKKILETLMSQPKTNLHDLVLQALNHEAKNMMR